MTGDSLTSAATTPATAGPAESPSGPAPATPAAATRRRFVGGALGAGAVALGLGTAAHAAPRAPAGGTGRRVAVFGAGVAGLTAAQELAERGFEVTVYERKELGGKSRSIPVPGTGTGGRRDLPGEHGFRFVPGFYHNLPETLARIPAADGSGSVHDHLEPLAGVLYSRIGGREDLQFESNPDGLPSVEEFQRFLIALFQQFTALPAHETAFFARQMAVFATSGDLRRNGEWEQTPWMEFLRAERMSEEFRKMFAEGMTTHLVASRPDVASTRATGILSELYFYALAGRGSTGYMGRVLDGPTSEVWIAPWVARLRALGVRFRVGWAVEELRPSGGRIAGARVRDPQGRLHDTEADWYVCAIPVERARALWSPALRAADPALARMDRLRTEWMNGIQFYLDRPTPVINGFVDYLDSPWALVSISQAQNWARDLPAGYGDGTVHDCFSVNIARWDTPGVLYGKPARECTREEIAAETLAQMRAALEDTGREVLPEAHIRSWHLDPAITFPGGEGGTAENDEPLTVSSVGAWNDRPEPATAVPNLFLASDYVRNTLSCATMEGANETGKRAVNALLEEAGSDADACPVHGLYVPPEFRLLRTADDVRYRLGLPHVLDLPWP
ncbi:FAD-dependent oxidoreductase [Streptomyces sp. JJ36]|uniref:hydroxysqualene dehydroxylase n=1 Tax=Streptomyces sp. JJ36 TaxID=2736645 RepID=UPI001F3D284E|nr:FAD-dependent oxidoreductase [Streptomyces sp. JJ36]MCF6524481.1 FAD-dependent oxidoreductase [Streptomyces sp. JJ36]